MTNKRSINMKRVSLCRSAEVNAMLLLLSELDLGGLGDFNLNRTREMQFRINSYRAQKIARFLGKNISKSHLIKFSKNKDTLAKEDLTDSNEKKLSVDEFIHINEDALLSTWKIFRDIFINEALRKLDSSHS